MLCPSCNSEASAGKVCPTCGVLVPELVASGDDHLLPAGTALQRRSYEIVRVLGQGGFGITYEGIDRALNRAVAIKEFFPLGSSRRGTSVRSAGHVTAAERRAQLESFVSEARHLARFDHAGIVRVFAVFEENETAYIVMEMLHGRTLQSLLAERTTLTEAETLDIARQVGRALDVVHGAGMLHRDIKPDNILLVNGAEDPVRAVLVDFGTARAFTAEATRAMTAQLTPAYAPLEQYAQQAHFGPYTDIYALAGTCYHCLTGQPPASAIDRVSGVEVAPLRTHNAAIMASTEVAIMHGLEIRAPDRPQSARAFLEELASRASKPVTLPAHVNRTPSPIHSEPEPLYLNWEYFGPNFAYMLLTKMTISICLCESLAGGFLRLDWENLTARGTNIVDVQPLLSGALLLGLVLGFLASVDPSNAFYVGPGGIAVDTASDKPQLISWHEIQRVKYFPVAFLPSLIQISVGPGKPPRCLPGKVDDPARLLVTVRQFAPPDNPFLAFLERASRNRH
jgi:serine/threonine protein kinase